MQTKAYDHISKQCYLGHHEECDGQECGCSCHTDPDSIEPRKGDEEDGKD